MSMDDDIERLSLPSIGECLRRHSVEFLVIVGQAAVLLGRPLPKIATITASCLVCVSFVISSPALGRGADEPKGAQPALISDAPKLTTQQRHRLREHDTLRTEVSKLRMAGKFDESLAIAEKMVAINREVFGKSHTLVAQSLTMAADIQTSKHDFSAAQRTWEEILAIQQEWGGADHWRLKDSRRMLDRVKRLAALDPKQLARLDDLDRRLRELVAKRQFDSAGPLLEEFLQTQKELLGERHQDLTTFALLAGVQQGRSQAQGEALWRKALDVCQATRGEEHPEYARILTQIGALTIDKDGKEAAKPVFDRAARIYLRTLGAFDLDYAPWVLHLARMQGVLMHQADRAEPLARMAAEIYEACRGDTDPQYVECLNQLGHFQYDRGAYTQAETLLKQVVEIRRATLGENHPQYAQSLLSLAMVYQAKGSPELAEPLYAKAKRIPRQSPKVAAPETATALREEATRQTQAGNNAEAEKLYLKLLEVDRKTVGNKHPDYANDLWRLATLYHAMRADQKAEASYQEAADAFKESLGETHRWYRTSLEALARLEMERGDYGKAEPLYRRLEALYRETEGERSFRYASALDQQGEICKARKDLDGAAAFFEKSLPIFRARLGAQVPLFTARLSSLAMLYAQLGNYDRAIPLMHECVKCSEQVLEEIFTLQSERQRLEALRRSRRALDQYLSVARTGGKTPAVELYQHVLRWKGAAAARSPVGLAREQPELKSLFDQLARTSTRLTELAYDPPKSGDDETWLRQVHTLRNEKEDLESEIARQSATFRWEKHSSRLEPKEVARVLPANMVFLDFFEYSGFQEERRLLAFVLRRDREPAVIEIDGCRGIVNNLHAWRMGLLRGIAGAELVAEELRQKLWTPLDSSVAGASTILIAPDGGLAYLPFAALPGAQPNSFLLEDVAIAYVTSGRQIVETFTEAGAEQGRGLLAVGGIDYGADAGSGTVPLAGDGAPLVDARTRAGFAPLPGTELEAQRCLALFRQAFPGERATLLSGVAPTEARLVRECGERYRFLHLATHGFFESPLRVAALVSSDLSAAPALARDSGRQAQALERLPLLRSGLALAGAARPPRPGDVYRGGGILTAEEVAALDLRRTDLAVLSACDTGLGEIESGQGVLGLQRAFHQAGIRALITTQWSVDDAATSVLMEEFYTNLWRRRMPKLEALRQAQLTVLHEPARVQSRRQELAKALPGKLRETKTHGGPSSRGVAKQSPPLLWAAFIFSGDPR
jgi:CHAT domain-containing protein